jgi:hypothetical protein
MSGQRRFDSTRRFECIRRASHGVLIASILIAPDALIASDARRTVARRTVARDGATRQPL